MKAIDEIDDLTSETANRLLVQADNCFKSDIRACTEFGLTPASRARLRCDQPRIEAGGLAEFVLGPKSVH